MAVPYAWRCLVCDASCPAGTHACIACGFPSRATGFEIEAARAGCQPRPDTPAAARGKASHWEGFGAFGTLPVWRQVFTACGLALGTGGAIGFKVAWSWAMLGWSLVATLAGVLLGVIGLSGLDKNGAGEVAPPEPRGRD